MTTRYQGHFEYLEIFEGQLRYTQSHKRTFWTTSLFLLVFAILSDALGKGPTIKADEFLEKFQSWGRGEREFPFPVIAKNEGL